MWHPHRGETLAKVQDGKVDFPFRVWEFGRIIRPEITAFKDFETVIQRQQIIYWKKITANNIGTRRTPQVSCILFYKSECLLFQSLHRTQKTGVTYQKMSFPRRSPISPRSRGERKTVSFYLVTSKWVISASDPRSRRFTRRLQKKQIEIL